MSSENVEPEAHPSREVVTREDLSDFRNFLLQQIKLHTSEPLLKFDKDACDMWHRAHRDCIQTTSSNLFIPGATLKF